MEAGVLVGIYIFVLALVAGAELISKVPQTLHTPLMSGSNAISGIALLGAILAAGESHGFDTQGTIAFLAVVFATVNVVGGYMVTNRMLQMFKKRKKG